jgi:hypothetical protein
MGCGVPNLFSFPYSVVVYLELARFDSQVEDVGNI